MSPSEVKRIREKLEMNQSELAEVLGLAGRITVTHYETGHRKPSLLTAAVMRLFDELPEKKSREFRESLQAAILRERKVMRKKS